MLLSLIMGQKSYGQIDGPDYNIPAGGFGAGVTRGILDVINQINPAGLVNFQTEDPTANVNITLVASNTTESSSNSYSTSTSSYNWGVNYLSLASVSSTSNCWICDVNNDISNTPNGSNNLPNSALTTTNSGLLGYSWNSSNNNLTVYYDFLTPYSPTVYTQEYADEVYSKVRADLDRVVHPWDFYFESVTPFGIELWHTEEPQPPFGKIDSEGNVTILTSDGIYKSPSQLSSTDKKDRRNLSKFAVYLGRSLDIFNKGIVIKTTIGDTLSSAVPAWTNRYDIYFNLNGGFSSSLNNVNNFKSILKHEIFHVDDNRYNINHPNDPIILNLSSHADVYIKAALDATYNNTTKNFRWGNAGSFANYLLNMDRTVGEFYPTEIISKIVEFNKNTANVEIVWEHLMFTKGNLWLKIKVDGEESDPIIFKKINNE